MLHTTTAVCVLTCSEEIGNFAYRSNLLPPHKSSLKVLAIVICPFTVCPTGKLCDECSIPQVSLSLLNPLSTDLQMKVCELFICLSKEDEVKENLFLLEYMVKQKCFTSVIQEFQYYISVSCIMLESVCSHFAVWCIIIIIIVIILFIKLC